MFLCCIKYPHVSNFDYVLLHFYIVNPFKINFFFSFLGAVVVVTAW